MTTTGMQNRHGTGSGSGGAWVSGWTAFAGAMMILGGTMAVFEGISAIVHDDVFIVTNSYSYNFNLTGWGWIHLILGILVFFAGIAVFRGELWARITGIVLAGLSMIANFIWLPHSPFWAIVLIIVDAFVIWALCVGTDRDAARTA